MREYALVFATAVAVTFVITGIIRIFARKIGAVTPIRDRDVHSVPTPRLGGVAVYLGVAAALLMAFNLPALSQAFSSSTEILGVLVAGGVICLVGALDDRFDLDAITKLAGQVLSAGLLVLFGVQWLYFRLPTSGPDGVTIFSIGRQEQVIITVLLTVLLINAMNFIDGLDGLLAGVTLISAAATFLFSVHQSFDLGQPAVAAQPPLLVAALAGACLGFLPHNFFPAKIFMGDSGAMFIGLLMAAAISSASFKIDPSVLGARTTIGLLAPLIVALAVVFIPLLDFLLAVVRRTIAGKSPLSADKRHLHHRMLAMGHSHRQAVLIFYMWALVVAGGAVALSLVPTWQDMIYPWLAAFAAALIVSVLPWVRNRSERNQAKKTLVKELT